MKVKTDVEVTLEECREIFVVVNTLGICFDECRNFAIEPDDLMFIVVEV